MRTNSGALAITKAEQNQLRQYLLGRLAGESEEQVEMRLLTDAAYAKGFDLIESELIDEYVYVKLPAGDVECMERYFFKAQQRRDMLKVALAEKRYRERRNRTRRLFRFYLPIAASVLLAVGLGLGVWQVSRARDVDKGLAALRAAYSEQRPVEARLTDFNYAPTVRGAQRVDTLQRDLAASLLTVAVREHPDARSHRALGQYYIAARLFDDAIKELEASRALDPRNARAHSDLGVALLERGREAQANDDSGKGLEFCGRSHDYLKRAIELDPSLLEARFNLPLVLQCMGTPHKAEEAWREYLERDRSSDWAQEARAYLRALEEQRQKTGAVSGAQALQDFLVAYRGRDDEAAWRILGHNREVIVGKFIPERLTNAYLESATIGRVGEAAALLDALDYAGELEARKAGDMYTAGVARFYRTLPPNRLATMANAHAFLNKGYEHLLHSSNTDAAAAFGDARTAFAAAGDEVESAFASYWLAYSYLHSRRTDESRSTTQALILHSKEKGYKWLLAQALNLMSNIQAGSHEHSAVLALTGEALSLSEQVNDAYGMQKHLASLAGKYANLYNFGESLNHLARCLRLADDFWPGTRQAWRNYDTAAQIFDSLGLYHASAAYGEESLRLVREDSQDPSLIYLAHVRLGTAYSHLQNYDDGVRLAQTGFVIGQSLKDEVAGRTMMAYSALQLGELQRQRGNYREAALNYDQAIGLYDQLAFQNFSVVAHRGRFLTYLAQGDDASAERELRVVLDLFEEYREKVKEEDNRTYFFDVAQETYDAAIDFAHSRVKDDETAFQHAETSRARSLLLLLRADAQQNLVVRAHGRREIQELMPERVKVVQFSVLADKLLIWVISKSHFSVTEKRIARDELNGRVRDYLSLVTRPTSDMEDIRLASAALYDIVIAPVEDYLEVGETLCVVPDKILHHLPFTSLVSPASGRYLIQDYPLLFSPSSSVFIIKSDVARALGAPAGERLLSVGNPSFDRRAFASLADLPSAAVEAAAVARHYETPSPLVLTGRSATKEAVVKAMGDADVIHLASHYVVDERSPARSQLLLAKPAAGGSFPEPSDGSLRAQDILNMKLRRPRLAVLSACQTGAERYYNGEGMIGMARTFLAAGVPLVVASQWPVETVSTSALMVSFHERRRRGGGTPTIEALRAAQIESINDPSGRYRHPYYWAPFFVVGGYASF